MTANLVLRMTTTGDKSKSEMGISWFERQLGELGLFFSLFQCRRNLSN